VSSPETKARLSVNQQVKAGLNAVRDFLAGRSREVKLDDTDDKATREVVGAELLAAMSGRNVDQTPRETSSNTSTGDTQEIPRFDGTFPETTAEENHRQQIPAFAVGISLTAREQSENSEQQQERARKLFLDHGYFDEATQDLRAAQSPAERASAARALGLFGSQRGTPHLIAAMFDEDPEVRSAAEEALAQISDPTVSTVSAAAELNIERGMAREAGGMEPNARAAETSAVQPIETLESGFVNTSSVEIENSVQQAGHATSTESAISSTATDEEDQLLQEEQTLSRTIDQVAGQLLETIAAIKESENEVRWRVERERQLRADAAERRREEDELRKRADEEAEARRRWQEASRVQRRSAPARCFLSAPTAQRAIGSRQWRCARRFLFFWPSRGQAAGWPRWCTQSAGRSPPHPKSSAAPAGHYRPVGTASGSR